MSYFETNILNHQIHRDVKTNYWSLFALRNENGRHVELKFVLSIPREYNPQTNISTEETMDQAPAGDTTSPDAVVTELSSRRVKHSTTH
ncbi:hypothetical protein L3Y34_002194 [Caenorhabditis briggsae]|uniref:polynucleotide adenylyltransferase n=1 Tax=Caenorhabditis briggsae TaxID=6238 RepID=A0AAE9DET7_CAEBR|nr:hypothetical protein L3Y34_002194 [Caenorhabditis briggsae]